MSDESSSPVAELTTDGASAVMSTIIRIVLIVLLAATVTALAIRPLDSYDVWTHLAIGRLMWEEGRIPDHEPFSYTQNREMSLADAAPVQIVRERVTTDEGRLVVAAGVFFDDDCRGKLEAAGIPAESVKLRIDPPLKRLTRDATDAKGNTILPAGTLLGVAEIEKLHKAGVDQVDVTVPWVNHEWLFQIPAYLSHKYLGENGPVYFRTAVILAAFLLVLLACYRRQTHVVGIAAVFLAASMSYLRFYMRPEVVSILFVAVWIYLLERSRSRRSRWIFISFPLMMIVWVNTHGYFILGPTIMLVYLLGEGLQRIIPMPGRLGRFMLWREDLIDGKRFLLLAGSTVLTIAATLVNPYGIAGARYPIDVLAQLGDASNPIRQIVGELQSPFLLKGMHALMFFWVLLWCWGISWVVNIRRIRLSRLILSIVGLVLMVSALRNMPFFALPAAIFGAINLNESVPGIIDRVRKITGPEVLLVGKWLCQAALATVMLFLIVWTASDNLHVFDSSTVRFGTGYTRSKFSMGAIDFIRKSDIKGNYFNSFAMGGLCMWKLYPEMRTDPGDDGPTLHYGGRRLFIDGRAEVYGSSFVKTYNRSMGNKELWEQLDRKFNFQVVFVNFTTSATHPLLARLRRDDEWVLCYGDGSGYVFVRNTDANKEVIDEAVDAMRAPKFVDFSRLYAPIAGCLPGVPSMAEFREIQQHTQKLALITGADVSLAANTFSPKDATRRENVVFDRDTMRTPYDRVQESMPWLPKRPIYPGEMMGRAWFALNGGQGDLAVSILRGLTELCPNMANPYCHRGNIHIQMASNADNREEGGEHMLMALELYMKAERMNPDYPGLVLQLLRTSDQLADRGLTKRYLERAINDLHRTPDVARTIGNVYMRRYGRVERQLRGLPAHLAELERTGDVAKARRLRARIPRMKAALPTIARNALRYYESVIDEMPERDSSALFERIAACKLRLGEPDEALRYAQRAADLNEKNSGAWFTLAEIHARTGKTDEAASMFRKAIALEPRYLDPARRILKEVGVEAPLTND